RNYQFVKSFMQRVLGNITLAVMQSERDAHRIQHLGLAEDRIAIAGNMKFDGDDPVAESQLTEELRQRLGITPDTTLIIAASTHDPEESVVIRAYQEVAARHPERRLKLLIAPRHPERFNETADLMQQSGLKWLRRSHATVVSPDPDWQAVLLDTIG